MARTLMKKRLRDGIRDLMQRWAACQSDGVGCRTGFAVACWFAGGGAAAAAGRTLDDPVVDAVDGALISLRLADQRLCDYLTDFWLNWAIDGGIGGFSERWPYHADTLRDMEARAYWLMVPALQRAGMACVAGVVVPDRFSCT